MKIPKDTLYYDGQCPLCAKEIQFLKQQQCGQLEFADIHTYTVDELPVDRATMLKRLHLLNTEQQWVIGLDATVQAWSHTRYGWFFLPLRWPLIGTLADWVYNKWADRRYQQRYDCARCVINDSKQEL